MTDEVYVCDGVLPAIYTPKNWKEPKIQNCHIAAGVLEKKTHVITSQK